MREEGELRSGRGELRKWRERKKETDKSNCYMLSHATLG
jgi:hypothetical protein